jgi:PHD/YefM family antitoxin component YafN of YafNO toxin-antitoxin module
MLKLPEVLGVAEARGEIAHVLEEVEQGRTFIIKGTKGREALVISADVFRRLQDAYLEVVGELETMKILSDERAMNALRESSGAGPGRLYTLSEVEGMIEEVEDVEGAQP